MITLKCACPMIAPADADGDQKGASWRRACALVAVFAGCAALAVLTVTFHDEYGGWAAFRPAAAAADEAAEAPDDLAGEWPLVEPFFAGAHPTMEEVRSAAEAMHVYLEWEKGEGKRPRASDRSVVAFAVAAVRACTGVRWAVRGQGTARVRTEERTMVDGTTTEWIGWTHSLEMRMESSPAPRARDVRAEVMCDTMKRCALTRLLCARPLSPPPPSLPSRAVRVMTANLWNYNYWDMRGAMLPAIFARERPALVGFQEVRSRPRSAVGATGAYQAMDLALLLPGHQFVHVPASKFVERSQGSRPEWHTEGVMAMSRLPLLEAETVWLTKNPLDPSDGHQRACVRVLALAPDGRRLNLMVTHLSTSLPAIRTTLPEAGDMALRQPHPSVLVGDFNDELRDEGMRAIFRPPYSASDLYAEAGGAMPGHTFHAWRGRGRIDFLLGMGGGLRAVSAAVVGANDTVDAGATRLHGVGAVSAADMAGRMHASDHLFVRADVTFTA